MEAVKATGGRGGVAQGEEGDVMEVVVTDEEVDLPAEVWAHVASFLPVRELAGGGLPLSCRRLHDLCSLDTLWQSAFRQQWPPRLEGRTSSASSPRTTPLQRNNNFLFLFSIFLFQKKRKKK
jgi:hypothetical protein